MEDLNLIKSWELKLRKEIVGLKTYKEKITTDLDIPKQVKERFVDVLRTVKMNMIQVIAKCAQLRSESLSVKALKVRMEKLKFKYDEVCKSLEQLLSTVDTKAGINNSGYRNEINDDEIHNVVDKELKDIRRILNNTKEELDTHLHKEYEHRIEILESENQELRRNLNRIQEDGAETFEILHSLKKRIEKLEMSQNDSRESIKSNNDLPKRRVLLKPSSHSEYLLNA